MTDEKQLLVDTLKFTPRQVRVSISGYGGEIVVGSITKEAYDYWKEQDEEHLANFVLDNCSQDQLTQIPEHAKFIESGAWYECDDFVHESGPEMNDCCSLTVVDLDTEDIIFESKSLDPDDLDDLGIETECVEEYHSTLYLPNTYCFMGQSEEKGLFFETEFEIQRPFDPSRIKIYYHDIQGLPIFYSMTYDGNSVEDSGNYDTTGKGSFFSVLSSDD